MNRLALALTLSFAVAASAADKPRVAVLYFDYSNDKDDDFKTLKKGFAQMVTTDLAGNDAIAVVERTRMNEIVDELNLQQSNKIDPATAGKIGKLLGAKYILMGSYLVMLGHLRVDARMLEVETGKIVTASKFDGKPDDFMDGEQKLSREMNSWLSAQATKMKLEPKETGGAPKAAAKIPIATAVKYSKALDALDHKDKEAAKKQLSEVVKEQPDFALAALDLAALSK